MSGNLSEVCPHQDMNDRFIRKMPIGYIEIAVEAGAVTRLVFPNKSTIPEIKRGGNVDDLLLRQTCSCPEALAVAEELFDQLGDYFAGKRCFFTVPYRLTGSAFELLVWNHLATVHYGQTISYGELARQIGRPNAARAVGVALGRNPVPILLPCHRVIGSKGQLTGFAGGIDLKRFLLRTETAPDTIANRLG